MMISSSSLIFIIAKNISLEMLSSLAAAVSPSPVQCRLSPPATSVDCYIYDRQSQRDDFVIGRAPPPTPPHLPPHPHLTPNFICSPLHCHRHPSVDCCLYGGSSALMTDTRGLGATSEALVRIGLNLIFQTIQFTSKGLLGKL